MQDREVPAGFGRRGSESCARREPYRSQPLHPSTIVPPSAPADDAELPQAVGHRFPQRSPPVSREYIQVHAVMHRGRVFLRFGPSSPAIRSLA